ncbi:putative F-box protein At4g38870 isoform X1 [Cornus florida]|uniref:putative F-box protein At4g38870 isoform X1 n=1 Tax=Cornus florida TaxID=4283 RepID=UPI002898CD0F|nr:putative F-box protein At4g38870 isoform X1 [Cornus florida]XP_059629484.1 putative F-box protein At4g38870 isoform X1 [Cornus florida]
MNWKGKGQMASCNDIDQLLPEDLIIEILSKLPVKSLIRARAVCKNWYTIIKNSSFVTKHFNHHTNNNSGRLFIYRVVKNTRKCIFSLFPDETLAGTPPVHQDVVVDMPCYIRIVASPYNGILCLFNRPSNSFAMWNPATREFRALPVLSGNFPPNLVRCGEICGFGLDLITNDYKVVWIWNTMSVFKGTSFGPYQVAVYTLSTDSWRYLDVVLPYSCIESPLSNTCINGVYHWCAMNNDNHPVILSFDMGTELFHEIRDIPSSRGALLAPYYNSYLALILYDYSPIFDIWVMMEEGCWTKQFTVDLPAEFGWPLGFWKNGQLIIQNDDYGPVALYDPETHEIKDLGSQNCVDSLVNRESLVSIRGGDGFLEQDHLSDVNQILNFSKTAKAE